MLFRPTMTLALVAVLAFSGCTMREVKQNYDDARNWVFDTEPTAKPSYVEDTTPMVELNYEAADKLASTLWLKFDKQSPVWFGTFVNESDPADQAPFGRVVTEQVVAGLVRDGMNMVSGTPNPEAHPSPAVLKARRKAAAEAKAAEARAMETAKTAEAETTEEVRAVQTAATEAATMEQAVQPGTETALPEEEAPQKEALPEAQTETPTDTPTQTAANAQNMAEPAPAPAGEASPEPEEGAEAYMPSLLTGSYLLGDDIIYVSARITTLDDQRVISAYQWNLPINQNTRALLPQLLRPQRGMTPTVQTRF